MILNRKTFGSFKTLSARTCHCTSESIFFQRGYPKRTSMGTTLRNIDVFKDRLVKPKTINMEQTLIQPSACKQHKRPPCKSVCCKDPAFCVQAEVLGHQNSTAMHIPNQTSRTSRSSHCAPQRRPLAGNHGKHAPAAAQQAVSADLLCMQTGFHQQCTGLNLAHVHVLTSSRNLVWPLSLS